MRQLLCCLILCDILSADVSHTKWEAQTHLTNKNIVTYFLKSTALYWLTFPIKRVQFCKLNFC